ncbi:MAG: transcriptional regulator [Acidimicrobiia bacterium]|nr:transcriptional regulator [Acidimicrobiia bacterium]
MRSIRDNRPGGGNDREGAAPIRLQLLGGFSVTVDGEPVDVAPSAQRFLAGIALLGGSANRTHLAETLWPDSPSKRGLANLRSAVWRMPDNVREGIEKVGLVVRLDHRWSIDLDTAAREALGLRTGTRPEAIDRSLFGNDLLPDWDEHWLIIRRERHRQLRLHALEDLAAAQITEGRALDAVDSALEAVLAEPLRESAQLLLVRAHIAAGNRCAALDQFERFRELLHAELDVEPGDELQALVATARGQRRH